MTEVKKRGFGKGTFGLLISVGLIVILAFSNLLLYNSVDSLTRNKNSLQTEVDSLENQVHQRDVEITDLQSELEKLERLKNVTSKLKIPYDYYTGKWSGEWQIVATFFGTDDTTTETFHISSAYNLWRINWTVSGSENANLILKVYTVSEPQYLVKWLSASGLALDYTVYIFWTSVTQTEFYIDIEVNDIYTWSMEIEKLTTAS